MKRQYSETFPPSLSSSGRRFSCWRSTTPRNTLSRATRLAGSPRGAWNMFSRTFPLGRSSSATPMRPPPNFVSGSLCRSSADAFLSPQARSRYTKKSGKSAAHWATSTLPARSSRNLYLPAAPAAACAAQGSGQSLVTWAVCRWKPSKLEALVRGANRSGFSTMPVCATEPWLSPSSACGSATARAAPRPMGAMGPTPGPVRYMDGAAPSRWAGASEPVA
mmetsp:Transcript_10977/g.29255  ORF Transcript_10977/g.29255 Transcript_10977/m.29255 type:complete len:220 (+) Transcript_10977:1063-1722(+)